LCHAPRSTPPRLRACLHHPQDAFPGFFRRLMALRSRQQGLEGPERLAFLQAIIHCFASLEDEMVRQQVGGAQRHAGTAVR
jgi:hypothetical protein